MCRNLTTILAVAVLTVPAQVSAICLTPDQATDTDDSGYATAVQADQGNGSIECSAFIGPGGPMFQIPVQQDKTIGTVDPFSPIRWTVNDPDMSVNADVVFIGNSDGSRCTQYYKGNARSGFAAAGTKDNKDATLVACSDGFSEPQPAAPPTPPVSTSGDCTQDPDDAALQSAINDNGKYDVVIGIGRGDKGDNTAICSDTNGLGAQKRCVDRCITPDPLSPVTWYEPGTLEYEDNCTGDGPFYPIECRACELSSVIDSDPYVNGSPQYCWEQLQKADLSYKGPDGNLLNGSFKKAPGPKSNQVWKVDEYAGSTCYKISGTTDTGYQYAYWVPTGCPK